MKFNRANFLFILISFAFFKFSIGLTNRKFTTTNTTSTTKTTTTSKQKFQKILPKSQSCPYGSNGAYCDGRSIELIYKIFIKFENLKFYFIKVNYLKFEVIL